MTHLDVVFSGVQELVYLCEASLHVPQQDQPKGGCGTHHAVTLILVQPLVPIVGQQLVLTKPHIHKAVHQGGSQVGRAESTVLAGLNPGGPRPQQQCEVPRPQGRGRYSRACSKWVLYMSSGTFGSIMSSCEGNM